MPFINEMASRSPKNYQLWNHRRRVAFKRGAQHAQQVTSCLCVCSLHKCDCRVLPNGTLDHVHQESAVSTSLAAWKEHIGFSCGAQHVVRVAVVLFIHTGQQCES